jgi:hypothetical protein
MRLDDGRNLTRSRGVSRNIETRSVVRAKQKGVVDIERADWAGLHRFLIT